MANITRIKNNQITDSTITYAKLASGTLVGSVFNANLTLNSNVTILGNLTVSGNPTTIQSTNTYVNDPLIVFNNGYTGSPSYDIGIIANRNLQSLAGYGSVNTAWIWEETAGQWQAIATTETGATTGAINNSGWANVRVGNLISVSSNVTGALTVGGNVSAATIYDNGNRVITGLTSSGSGNLTISGTVPSLSIALPSTGPGATTWGGATQIPSITVDAYGRVSTAGNTALNTVAVTNLGNTTEITANASVGLVGLNLTTTGVTAGNYGSASVIPTIVVDSKGRVTSITTNAASTSFTVAGTSGTSVIAAGSTLSFASTNGVTIAVGNTYANISTPQDVRTTANPTFNNITGASLQGVIGNVTPTTATFTTVTTGGLQALAIGNATPGTGAFTTLSSSGVTTLDLTSAVAINNTPIGNATPSTGAFTTLSASSTLNVTGATTLTTANVGGLQAVAIGNVTPGSGAFTTGTFSSTLGVTGATTLTTTTTGGLQAVAIGNVTPGTAAFTTLTASTWANVTSATESTTATNGALVVAGGVGIAKNLNVGGNAVITGNLTVQGTMTAIQSQTLDVTDLNITVAKGAASAAAANGAGITVDTAGATITYASADDTWNFNKGVKGTSATFNTETVGGLQAVAIGNVSPGIATFTTLTATGASNLNTVTAASYQGAIGNATPNTGAFTTLSASGATTLNTATAASFQGIIGNATPAAATFTTVNVTGTSTLNTVTAASYQGVIGNVTPASATFTTATFQQGIQNTPIGNATPSTGAFTTLTASTWANVTGTTASTSTTTGALLVTGGAGIQGNLNVGVFGTSVHSLAGNVLIGQGPINTTAVDSILTINENTDVPVTANGFTVHMSGKSGRSAIYGADSFGTSTATFFYGRHARGTSTTPTAVQNDDLIGGVVFKGHGTTGYSGPAYLPAGLQAVAKENFTDTAQGTAITIATVPTGSNTAVTAVYVGTDGNVVVKSNNLSTSTTTGALVVAGGAGIVGNVNVGGGLNVSNFIYGNNGAQFAGNISSLSTADTVAPGTGSFNTPGGASINGNVYVGKAIYIGPTAFNTVLTSPTIVAVNTGAAYAQMAMLNTANTGSSDFIAYPSDYPGASNDHGWADLGFTGNAFNDPSYTITKANDAYLFGSGLSGGGNLVLATDYTGTYNDVVIGTGSFYANSEVARFHGNALNNGTFVVKLPTNTVPTANTGALQVWGGASFGGNVYHAGAATFNGSQTANYDFLVKGKTDNSLIWARPGASYDQVVVGGSLTPSGLTGGAKLAINSTDSMLLPTGTTGQRPSSQGFSDVQGMFRFNTTLGAIEWYTGSIWQTVSTTFTIITDEQFNGDGSTLNFTLGAATTTAGTIVSINGIVQIPTLAYSITGAGNTTLTFTEAPGIGDVIDVRRLTTTQTLFGVASPNGKMAFQTDNNGVYIYTGPTGGTSTASVSWDAAGSTIRNVANVTVSSANVATTVLAMDTTKYRSGKMLVQATSGTSYQVSEALVITDGTTATIVNYGTVQTSGNLGIVTATQSGGNVLVQFTAVNAGTVVRLNPDLVTI
jgi:hypothetical protein